MRIISGKWRTRPIISPVGDETRPTADRTRETLFSMLQSRLGSFEGLTILDLFAGSGALSFEALSHGAEKAFLVEKAPAARKAIDANIVKLSANARLMGHDATSLPQATAPADLIFLDPPYLQGLCPPAVLSAQAKGWIAPHTWISIETMRGETIEIEGFETEVERGVGKAMIHLLRPKA